MNIIYTKHAEEQIEERKIDKIWVEETIKFPNELKREDNKYYATKKLNGNILRVVYVKENYIKIITTYFVQ